MGFKPSLADWSHLPELLSDICLLKFFRSLFGIVAYRSKVIPHHSGHLVRSDLSLGAWAESRRQVLYEDYLSPGPSASDLSWMMLEFG